MATNVNLKALGLNFSPNLLEVEPGSLTKASNVIIKRQSIIEPRRGFKLYDEAFGTSSDRAKQLLAYKGRLLKHYSNILAFDTATVNIDGEEIFNNFSGTYSEVQDGLRIKSIESNKNLYFTTADGIKKISAATADDLSTASGYITQAGAIKAVDLTSELQVTQGNISDFLPQDSTVAYRLVWGSTDANDNLILGAPSQRTEVYNYLSQLLAQDLVTVLGALDDINQAGSLVTDGNYVNTLKLPISASGLELKNNIGSLSEKLDLDIGYTTAVPNSTSQRITTNSLQIVFSAPITTYILTGDTITYTSSATGDLTGKVLTVTSVSGSTVNAVPDIDFAATDGAPVADAAAVIVSYNYRNIFKTGNPPNFPLSLEELTIDTPATDAQLAQIQDTLDRIILRLQTEPIGVISSALQSAYVADLGITTSASVKITATIPEGITTSNFYQLYRSGITQATGTDVLGNLTASDEMRLIFEGYPSSSDISAGEIVILDNTPDAFAGAFLYTNPSSGEGILQANDLPPFAKDINRFKGYIFYANTKTRHRKTLNLLGVQNIITSYNNSESPAITISDENGVSNTYYFVTGLAESTELTFGAAEGAVNTLEQAATPGSYFTLYSANDEKKFYFWFSNGVTTDPAPGGFDPSEGVEVVFLNTDTNAQVAGKARDVVSRYLSYFSSATQSSPNSHVLDVSNVSLGSATDSTIGGTGLSVAITQDGRGEDASLNQILLSTNISPAIAVDETARSMVRILNKNLNELTYAYYLSGSLTLPGTMLLEARGLTDSPFYVMGSNSSVGTSFNPNVTPELTLSTAVAGVNITVSDPTVITTSTPHGYVTGTKVLISGTAAKGLVTIPAGGIDGISEITVTGANTFTIPYEVTTSIATTLNEISINNISDIEISNNEVKPNRLYYSKYQQPEAVPQLNFIDIGAEDKEILRIFPLRDSLFIFKEEGLYRLSGEIAPFQVSLFDSSCLLIAPDSVAVSNNQVFGWTTQGISSVTEVGVSVLSRPIDVDVFKFQSSNYPNFNKLCFGVGYESDNSYLVWASTDPALDVANFSYRYSTLTNTWTTYDKSNSCGIVSPSDDKMYLGAGDTNNIEQERKTFSRKDYADREIVKTLTAGNYFNKTIKFNDVTDIAVGDILLQEQTLTTFKFNSLLEKLDMDPTIPTQDFYSSLFSVGGVNIRLKLTQLAAKLDADIVPIPAPTYASQISDLSSVAITSTSFGSITSVFSPGHGLLTGRYVSISGVTGATEANGQWVVTVTDANNFTIPISTSQNGTGGAFSTLVQNFNDVKGCFNIIINKLNNDLGVSFSNYSPVESTTSYEAVVLSVDKVQKQITVSLSLDLLIGPLTIFKAFSSDVIYYPVTFSDASQLKHIREATIMFTSKAFTKMSLGFSTDLLPKYLYTDFFGDGPGLFGGGPAFGYGFFGGGSHAAPFRTYIPREKQRCRTITINFIHRVARENFEILGVSLTGDMTSERAYR